MKSSVMKLLAALIATTSAKTISFGLNRIKANEEQMKRLRQSAVFDDTVV